MPPQQHFRVLKYYVHASLSLLQINASPCLPAPLHSLYSSGLSYHERKLVVKSAYAPTRLSSDWTANRNGLEGVQYKRFTSQALHLLQPGSRMHRSLQISEIIRNIFFLTDDDKEGRRTLARCCLTCRFFYGPSADALWYHIPDFAPLLKCLPAEFWFEGATSGDHDEEFSRSIGSISKVLVCTFMCDVMERYD